eukprot:CAMPEP_0198123476 /NCGR_PEP_ID=MMETSP1442-20131203/37640_1 /TAXON_ID= /ORGANISM="Craspedostauros australis, Strain CCMP3328" /LENGTH=130 /DNA_ID=CAMNT_0043782689 /DNA_START=32 /DNA_END=422 /DNA_ORIENTATION=+
MKVAAGDSSVDADAEEKPNNASHDPFGAISTQATTATSTRRIPPLSVRDADGKWTREYATQVLEYMSIPAQHETADDSSLRAIMVGINQGAIMGNSKNTPGYALAKRGTLTYSSRDCRSQVTATCQVPRS